MTARTVAGWVSERQAEAAIDGIRGSLSADVLSALDSALSLHAIAVKLTGDPAPSDKAKRAVAGALAVLLEQGAVRRFDQDITFYERVDPSIGSSMPTARRTNPDDPDGLLEPLEKNPPLPTSRHGFRRPVR